MGENSNKLQGKRCTLLIFNDQMDSALAAFILGKTALSEKMAVDFYFAFWGLNVIRKDKLYSEESTLLQKMLETMSPRGSVNLPTSRFNFMGLGPVMFKAMMEEQDAPSLEELIAGCLEEGARFWCCKLSREVMGYSLSDLMDGVQEGTAVDFLTQACKSDFTLFI